MELVLEVNEIKNKHKSCKYQSINKGVKVCNGCPLAKRIYMLLRGAFKDNNSDQSAIYMCICKVPKEQLFSRKVI